jgi:hypothetical protein
MRKAGGALRRSLSSCRDGLGDGYLLIRRDLYLLIGSEIYIKASTKVSYILGLNEVLPGKLTHSPILDVAASDQAAALTLAESLTRKGKSFGPVGTGIVP